MQRGARDTATAQADNIEPGKRRDLAHGKTERNDVAGDAANASHHNAFADLHELMDGRVAADEGVAADADVTAEHGVVRKGDIIANVAIMRDVEPTMKKQRSPIRVTPPPALVPIFMVTPSRTSQRAPITSWFGSPR